MKTISKITLVIGLVGISGMSLTACGSSTPTSTTPTTSAGPDASTLFQAAYNRMVDATNAQTDNENSSDPSTSASGWNAAAAARQTFDQAVTKISFPGSAGTAVQTLISSDVALESLMKTLAINTNDVSNYNSIFTSVNSAEATFAANASALAAALGLNFN